jgi:hypothetical protein
MHNCIRICHHYPIFKFALFLHNQDDKRKKLYYGSDTHGIDVMEKACSDSFGQGYKLAMDVLVGREVSVELGRETGNGLQVTRPSKPSAAVPSFFWAAKC